MVNKKLLLTILLGIFFISFTSAISIQQLFPTTNPFITNSSTVNLSYSIHAPDGVSSITQSINGTNYTLYDYTLVGFWNFDNRSALGENDTIVKDISMYGNNGTVVGGENITWTANGKYGGAFNFSGSKGYVSVYNSSILTSDNMTFYFWINSEIIGEQVGIIRKWVASGTQRSYLIGFEADNTLRFQISANGTDFAFKSSSTTRGLNVWENWVIVKNGSNVSFYKNGIFNRIQDLGVGYEGIHNDIAYLEIGRRLDDGYFNGSIDEVLIFNRSLSQAEVTFLYNSNIQKYNSSYYEHNTTSGNLNVYLQSSFLCASNLTGYETCSATQEIRQVNTIKSNFSTSKGVVRNNFYGVHIGSLSNLDSNERWDVNKQEFLNIGLSEGRYTIYLDRYYSNTTNSTGVNFTDYSTIPLANYTQGLKWLYENNKTVNLIIAYLPSFLADNSSGYCSSLTRCYPTNYTKFNNIVLDYIERVTNNGEYISAIEGFEFWNEPDLHIFFLGLVADDNQTRSDIYNEFYNQTRVGIKAVYPTIPFYGPSISTLYYATGKSLLNDFLEVNGNNTDGISIHQYYRTADGKDFDTLLTTSMNFVLANCTQHNVDCYPIRITEGNVQIAEMMFGNETAQISNYSKNIGLAWMYLLNNNPANYSFNPFLWTSSSTSYYPYKFYMTLNDGDGVVEHTSLYNVTENMAHLCPSQSQVYVTSNDDDTIKQVSCKKGNQYSLIIINTDTNAKNVTLNLSRENGTMIYPYRTLVNYEDEDIKYKISDANTVENLLFDSYDILYLRSGEESGATLRGLYKLNEYSGNTVYDSRINISNGTKSGASWVTDGVLNKIPTSKYTINLNSGLTSLSNDYLYEYLTVSYNTVADKTSLNALTSIENSGSTAVNFLPLAFLVTIFGAILFLVLRFLSPYIELGQNLDKF